MSSHQKTTVLLGLGSNLGDREGYIALALERLDQHPAVTVIRRSGLMETAPWGVADQPAFINAVAELRTPLGPRSLLRVLKETEINLGRRDRGLRWGPREIDLDILFYGDLVLEDPDLKIPHERILERSFVIAQVLELAPDLVHPGLGVPLRDFLPE